MNSPKSIADRMQYIQDLFLSTQAFVQKEHSHESIMSFLDSEPVEYRSVAYESASMEIALQELTNNNELYNWKGFYNSNIGHTFHMQIGLGWAFAKASISPLPFLPFLQFLQPAMECMIYDGVGYYHGLFKGRKTINSQLIPEGLSREQQDGFDQGLGRRLWYRCKGEVNALNELLKPFRQDRERALWRGIGIATAYVGGADTMKLKDLLSISGRFATELTEGVALAAMSRQASNSVTADIELACELLC